MVLVAVAVALRYQIAPLERLGAVARLDRWTGQVELIRIDGKHLGSFPSWDPFRDGQATLEYSNVAFDVLQPHPVK